MKAPYGGSTAAPDLVLCGSGGGVRGGSHRLAKGGEVAGHLGVGGRWFFFLQDLCRFVAAVRSVAVRLKIRAGGGGVLKQVYMK